MATRPKAKATTPARKASASRKPSAAAQQSKAAPTSARSTTKALGFQDFEAIRQLLSRYCMLIDQGDLVGLSELYHRNATFSVSFDSVKSHSGREAILNWYARFFRERPGKVGFPRHKLFEPCIIAERGTVTASSYFDSDFVEESGAVRILAGRYDDVLVKNRGRWFFKSRTIVIHHHYSPGKAHPGMMS